MAEEIVPPEVIGITLQPNSGSKPLEKQKTNSLQKIGFYAYGRGGNGGSEEGSLTVLADEGSPTVTGGWVKLAKVQRFQRISVTVPEGYDPRVLTVPVLFDATLGNRETGAAIVEKNIKTLEWMAGRPEHPTVELTGEPPYVQVYALDSHATPINLVPSQFQALNAQKARARDTSEVWKEILTTNPKLGSNPEKKLKNGTKVKYPENIVKLVPREEYPLWYITNLTFDANPLRARGGNRIRQKVVVELTEIVLAPSAQARAEQESEGNSKKYKTFTVSSGVDTIKKIAKELTRGRA